MRTIPAIILVAVVLASAAPAMAHLGGGADKVVGPYLVDLGWDPAVPVAGETVALAFNLIDNEKAEPVDFDNVWVRIASDETIIFAGVLRPEGRNVTFSLLIPNGGMYQVTARFKAADGSILAETSFPFPVDPNTATPLALGAGIAASIAFGWWFGRRSFQRTSTMR